MIEMDADAAAVLVLLGKSATSGVDPGVDQRRRAFADAQRMLAAPGMGRPFDGRISDDAVDGHVGCVPIRRYEPTGSDPGNGVVYFHGGGWVLGDLDTGDPFARLLATRLRATVISVDYRLAPEHPFPAGLDDCLLVARAARAEFTRRCALVGDSAGGNLALAVALSSFGTSQFDAQLLLYPCLDASMAGPSYEVRATGSGLTREDMRFFWAAYAGEAAPRTELLSPGAATDLSGLPPTIIASAGFDVLHDENRLFARRLGAAGVSTHELVSPTLPHGFIETIERVPAARQATLEAVRLLRTLLRSS